MRPLSEKMIAQMRRARAIELSKTENNICGTDDFKDTLPALYERGLLDIKMVTRGDKEILCVYITKSGIAFLDGHQQDRKGVLNQYNIH